MGVCVCLHVFAYGLACMFAYVFVFVFACLRFFDGVFVSACFSVCACFLGCFGMFTC